MLRVSIILSVEFHSGGGRATLICILLQTNTDVYPRREHKTRYTLLCLLHLLNALFFDLKFLLLFLGVRLIDSCAFITHRWFFQFSFRLRHFDGGRFIVLIEDKIGCQIGRCRLYIHLMCVSISAVTMEDQGHWHGYYFLSAENIDWCACGHPYRIHQRRTIALTIHGILSFRFIFV